MVTTQANSKRRLHRSTKWLITIIAIGLTLIALTRILGRFKVLPADAIPAPLLQFVILLGLVLLLGNIIVTEAWFYLAERTRERQVMRFAAQAVNWADVFFTAPGIYLAVISGLLLIEQNGVTPGWLIGAEIASILAGIVWMLGLVPMQNGLAVRAAADELDADFYRNVHRWYWLGLSATALTLVAVAFVIFQPNW